MGEDVPLGYNAPPRDLGMGLLEARRNPAGSFTDDLYKALYRQLKRTVFQVPRQAVVRREAESLSRGIEHIPGVNPIDWTVQGVAMSTL